MQKQNPNKAMRNGKKIVGLALPLELFQKIDRKCQSIGISRQSFITLAIHKVLQNDEDFIPVATGA